MNLKNIEDISIYVGPSCNFDCKYCDRSYVKSVGVDSMECDPALVDFVVSAVENIEGRPMISFHGGETLVYVKTISKIIDAILERIPKEKIIFYIQTNGSLILTLKDFFIKYKDVVFASISYDFAHQAENRAEYDIDSTLQFLNENNIGVQCQYVMPTNNKKVFDISTFTAIISLYKKYRINNLNLIILRHIRHADRFETVIADKSIDLKQFFLTFIQFIQLLYVAKINVSIDGHKFKIDKHYYENHKQVVLAPNGLIVPEYQFIEYGKYDFAIGRWKPFVELCRDEMPPAAQKLIRKDCVNCASQELCGLRYHYAMFNIDPPAPERCREFYSLNVLAIRHLYKLREKDNLLSHLGIQQ